MASSGSDAAFAYHEPSISTLLNQAGLLVVLNLINVCLDKLLYCGLIGQLFVGILWGTPGAKWLDTETERVIQQLGYIGLIMLVYEGGLSTSIKSMRANLVISLCVAHTGIGVPMGLSFILGKLVSASPLQAFAAGASLSATSLGTTFTILSTTNLIPTRLGTVTTSAAMLDDVVGLVMVQIISNLGGGTSSFNAVTVVRPLFVSIGFGLGVFILCAFCLKPILQKALTMRDNMPQFMGSMQFAFLAQTSVLVGLVAGATYAGTSSLFAAYLAGVIISWFDGLAADSYIPNANTDRNTSQSGSGVLVERTTSEQSTPQDLPDSNTPSTPQEPSYNPHEKVPTGIEVYEKYYKEPVNRILIPLFFASIGFAIPITEMFRGDVVWRGIIYAILMMFGKMVTGLWLVRFSLPSTTTLLFTLGRPFSWALFSCTSRKGENKKKKKSKEKDTRPRRQSAVRTEQSDQNADARNSDEHKGNPPNPNRNEPVSETEPQTTSSNPSSTMSLPPKPKSLYPPFILGLAMVARGEVGYLIASLAESQGMFSGGSNGDVSEIYLDIPLVTPSWDNMAAPDTAAFPNYNVDLSHVEDPNERRRLALARIDDAPFGWRHARAVVVAGVGFFTDSYDIFAINLCSSMLGVVFWEHATNRPGKIPYSSDTAIKVSTSAGTVVGQLFFGWLADIVGRKRMYGIELIIIILATLAQCLSSNSPAVSITGLLVFWRTVMGIGIGGDYPLSSIITSEFATTKHRGAMMGAVFAMQGFGQFAAAIVALIVTVGFKGSLESAASVSKCSGVCQLAVDKIDLLKADEDVDAYIWGKHEGHPDEVKRVAVLQSADIRLVTPKSSWSDFRSHFTTWKHGKVLLGTAGSWFFLDVAFYGLGLNNSIILTAIGWNGGSTVYEYFYRNAVGNLILICAGAIPGYWVTVATVDRLGRKPIQITGFVILTIIFIIIGFAYEPLKRSNNGLLALYVVAQFFFNFGPNATTFIVPGECFPTRYRSTSHGISAASGKVGAIIAQCVFGPLAHRGAKGGVNSSDTPWLNHVMQIFALFMLCGCLTSLLIPETKRLTLEYLSGEEPTPTPRVTASEQEQGPKRDGT
ncbi:phosphate:H+ symporter [Aspergillus piperis CBS 112811]|uniref:Phosphate:H+ symporter n=1 Tax=Aspergillus piperis CBS 112811 TaxID=1448313 RepID=A0A8G1QRQ4_9EURO|nr:phosphate:H+ symporter [Aspergillus piperis CBS 112811]RAH53096.1 phosphate:H+ symporter [Aspergillus piperis CBS 112811]